MDDYSLQELLESHHEFPGVYRIKVIGVTDNDFENRVVQAVIAALPSPSDLDYSARTTPSGRHVSLTLEVNVQTADEVLRIYERIRPVEGLTMLL
jgi:putative lipoic acid-binding regulatory protein